MKPAAIQRVILADDDEDELSLFRDALANHANVEITYVNDGNALLRVLAETVTNFDFIFIDMNMPMKGGKECLREIRAEQRFNATPVIMYSIDSSNSGIKSLYDIGANLFMAKPDSLQKLQKALNQIIEFDWNSGKIFTPKWLPLVTACLIPFQFISSPAFVA